MVSSPKSMGIYAVAVVLGVISIIAIVLRLAARRSLVRRTNSSEWKSDDWLVSVTLLFLWGQAIILIYGAAVGTIGTHTKTNLKTGSVIATPHENQISMFGGISQILAVLALGALKAGVILFYRRIFIGVFFRKTSLGALVFIAIWTIAFFLATVLECKGQNLDLLWRSIQTFKQQCYEYKTIQLAHCVTDVATDLMVLVLPLREIWNLHMETRHKINISLIFLIGLLSTAAGITRLVIVAEDIVETTAGARDVRGVETNVLVWTSVEIGVAIVAACLPTLGPLANRRSINSIVASIRSQVSLNSMGSSNSQEATNANPERKDLQLVPYPGSSALNSESNIGLADGVYAMTGHQTIRRDDTVTVQNGIAE